jgi:hypothetical protein
MGKGSVAVNLMAMSAMLWPRNYVYMFPLLVQARAALWTNFGRRRGGNVLDLAFPHEMLAVARRQSAKFWELRAATSLARLWRDQGKSTEALDLLSPIYGWFSEGFDTPVLRDAKALLDQLG